LNRLLLIVTLFIVTTVSSQAQSSRANSAAGVQTTIVRFYPNPATTVINFDFQKTYEQGYSIQIFNAILGRKMHDQVNIPERTMINLSDFPRGMYIYQLRDKSGRMVESGKFQVAK
jgi:Secretion system C-terminal sorting domain